jgi:hypothetical protein
MWWRRATCHTAHVAPLPPSEDPIKSGWTFHCTGTAKDAWKGDAYDSRVSFYNKIIPHNTPLLPPSLLLLLLMLPWPHHLLPPSLLLLPLILPQKIHLVPPSLLLLLMLAQNTHLLLPPSLLLPLLMLPWRRHNYRPCLQLVCRQPLGPRYHLPKLGLLLWCRIRHMRLSHQSLACFRHWRRVCQRPLRCHTRLPRSYR